MLVLSVSISNNSSTNYGEKTMVATHSFGEKIIGSLRNSFTGNDKMRRGDFYINQSRELFQRYLQIIGVYERHIILDKYTDATRQMSQEENWRPAVFGISRP